MDNKETNRKILQHGGDTGTSQNPTTNQPTNQSTNTTDTPGPQGPVEYRSKVTPTDLVQGGFQGPITKYTGTTDKDRVYGGMKYDQFGNPVTPKSNEMQRIADGNYHHKDIDAGGGWEKFKDYLPEQQGAIAGIDHRRRRAEAQTTTEQLGRALTQLPGGIAYGILENVGYLGVLINDDGDYSNSLTRWASKKREGLTENNQIYLENPNETWDVTDNAWWINHGLGLVESVGEFAATGFGVGGALTKGASMTANALKATALTGKILQGGAQIATAGGLAFVEGAMTGQGVYKKIYQEQLNRGMSEEYAKKRAAEAATQTVRMNTMINTVLNLTSVAPMFRGKTGLLDDVTKAERSTFNALKNETLEQQAKRIKNSTAGSKVQYDKFGNPTAIKEATKLDGLKGAVIGGGIEALQEGAEEMVNLWSEKAGESIGMMSKKQHDDREIRNVVDGFLDFEAMRNNAHEMFTEEGGLNFFLGAMGGIGQTAIMENLPVHKQQQRYLEDTQIGTDDNGNPVTAKAGDFVFDNEGEKVYEKGFFGSRISGNKTKQINEHIAFNRAKAQISKDLETVNQKTKELKQIAAANDLTEAEKSIKYQEKITELFNFNAYQAVRAGTMDHLKATFKHIAETDNSNLISNKAQEQLEVMGTQLEALKQDPEANAKAIEKLEEQKKVVEAQLNQAVTPAMLAGLAKNQDDNSFVDKANEAVETLDELSKTWKGIKSKYSYGDAESHHFAKQAFLLKADIISERKRLNKYEEAIKSDEALNNQIIDSMRNDSATQLKTAFTITQELRGTEEAHNKLVAEEAQVALNPESAGAQMILNKYKENNPGMSTEAALKLYHKDVVKRKKALTSKADKLLAKKKEALINAAKATGREVTDTENIEKANEATLEKYGADLNATLDEMQAAVGQKTLEDWTNFHEQAAKTTQDEKTYAELTSTKGRTNFIKSSKKYWKDYYSKLEQQLKDLAPDLEDNNDTGTDKEPEPETDKDKDNDNDNESDISPYEKTVKDEDIVDAEQEFLKAFFNSVFTEKVGEAFDSTIQKRIPLQDFLNKLKKFKLEGSTVNGEDLFKGYQKMFDHLVDKDVSIILGKDPKTTQFAQWSAADNSIEFNISAKLGDTDDMQYYSMERFKRAMIHELVHAIIRHKLLGKKSWDKLSAKEQAFYDELEKVIMSLAPGKTMNESIDNLLTKIGNQIDAISSSDASSKHAANIKKLQAAWSSMRYIKNIGNSMGKNIGIEELVTQALSDKDFALWLHEQKTPVADGSGKVGNVSLWDRIKALVLDMLEPIIGPSKLNEITNILNRHIPGFAYTFDKNSIKFGPYKMNGKDIDIKSINHVNRITYTEGGDTKTMSVERYFDMLKDDKLESLGERTLQHMMTQIDMIQTLSELEDSKEGFDKAGLGQDDYNKLMNHYDAKRLSLLKQQEETASVYISEAISQSETPLDIAMIFPKIDQLNDATIKAQIKLQAFTSLRSILEANKEFASVFNTPIFSTYFENIEDYTTALEISKEELYKELQLNHKALEAAETMDQIREVRTDFNKSLIPIESLFNKTKSERIAFNSTNPEYASIQKNQWMYIQNLKAEFDAAFAENYHTLQEHLRLQQIENEINNTDDAIETGDTDNGSDLLDGPQLRDNRRLVQLKKVKDGKIVTDENHEYNTIYEVVDSTDDSFTLVSIDKADEDSNYIEVPREDIYFFQDSLTDNSNQKEKIWKPDFLYTLYIHQFDKIPTLPESLSLGLINNYVGAINAERDQSKKPHSNAAKEMIQGYFVNRKDIDGLLKEIEKYANGTYLTDDVDSKEFNLANYASRLFTVRKTQKGAFKSELKLKTQQVITQKLWKLQREDKNLADHIKFSVQTDISVDGNKLLLDALEDQSPKSKLAKGLMHANETKKNSGKPFIAVHNWTDIDIGVWLNNGTQENPDWYYIGNPQNPYIYHKVSADQSTSSPYHPGIILDAYNKTDDPKTREELLKEFNELYADQESSDMTETDLIAFGEASNKAAKMFDTLSTLYDGGKNGNIDIMPDQVKELFDFDYTAGSFNFAPYNKRNSVTDFFNNPVSEKYLIGSSPILIDTREIKGDAQSYVQDIIGGSLALESRTAEELGINTQLGKSITKEQLQGNRYWMLVKDVKGNVRPIKLRQKPMGKGELNNFLKDFKRLVSEINKEIEAGADITELEMFRTVGQRLHKLMKGPNGFFFKLGMESEGHPDYGKKAVFLSLAPHIIKEATQAKENNKPFKLGLDSFSLKVVNELKYAKQKGQPNEKYTELEDIGEGILLETTKYKNPDHTKHYNINIATANDFLASLQPHKFGLKNMGTTIPKDAKGGLDKQKAMDILEVPTKSEMFMGSTIQIKMKDNHKPIEKVKPTVIKDSKPVENEPAPTESQIEEDVKSNPDDKDQAILAHIYKMKGNTIHMNFEGVSDLQKVELWKKERKSLLDNLRARKLEVNKTNLLSDKAPKNNLKAVRQLLKYFDIQMARDVNKGFKKTDWIKQDKILFNKAVEIQETIKPKPKSKPKPILIPSRGTLVMDQHLEAKKLEVVNAILADLKTDPAALVSNLQQINVVASQLLSLTYINKGTYDMVKNLIAVLPLNNKTLRYSFNGLADIHPDLVQHVVDDINNRIIEGFRSIKNFDMVSKLTQVTYGFIPGTAILIEDDVEIEGPEGPVKTLTEADKDSFINELSSLFSMDKAKMVTLFQQRVDKYTDIDGVDLFDSIDDFKEFKKFVKSVAKMKATGSTMDQVKTLFKDMLGFLNANPDIKKEIDDWALEVDEANNENEQEYGDDDGDLILFERPHLSSQDKLNIAKKSKGCI